MHALGHGDLADFGGFQLRGDVRLDRRAVDQHLVDTLAPHITGVATGLQPTGRATCCGASISQGWVSSRQAAGSSGVRVLQLGHSMRTRRCDITPRTVALIR